MPGWHSADESVSELPDGAFQRLPDQKKSSDLDGAGETDIRFGGFTQEEWPHPGKLPGKDLAGQELGKAMGSATSH